MRVWIIIHGWMVDFDAIENQRNSEYEKKELLLILLLSTVEIKN